MNSNFSFLGSPLIKMSLLLLFFFFLRDICKFLGMEGLVISMFVWWFSVLLLFLSILPVE